MPEKKDASASLPDRLAADPKNPPDLTLLQGWLGASSEAGHRRLYLDPELCNSLEIPEDAIVHTQEIPRDTNPLGGDWVWVKAEAAVKQGPGVERMYARFLRGQIQQDWFGGGGGAAAAGGMVGGPAPAAGAVAGPIGPIRTFFNCPSRVVICRPSVLTICASSLVICRPSVGIACVPSAAVACPTIICPSAVDACPSAPGGCDPFTIVQTGTIFQQPADFGGVAGGGLGFDPGLGAGGFAAGGGMVGGPGGGIAGPIGPVGPIRTVINCHTQVFICRPSVLTICASAHLICPSHPIICNRPTINNLCVPSAAIQCATRICPSAVDGCPSAPGGCDPWTIVQTGTIVQQPDFGAVAGGGLGFDPGLAAGGFGGFGGGMVGGPNPAAAAGPIGPIRTFFGCPSRVVLCRPSVLTICTQQVICPTQPIICRPTLGIGCVPSAAIHCPTLICPSAVDACPSAPGGCDPFTVVQTGTIVQQPADFGAGGGLGFDPGIGAGGFGGVGGGMVGGPAPGAGAVAQPFTVALSCHLVTHNIIQCRPTFTLQQCRTLLPVCWPTRVPQFCFTAPHLCQTQFCPTLPNGCPSGPICGGGGFPGGGGGF